jgi:hypothetical protein
MAYRKKDKFGMGLHNVQIRVQRAIDMDAYNILIFTRANNGDMRIVKPMKFEFQTIGRGDRIMEPSLQLDGMIAGDLLDAMLKEAGDMGLKTQEDSKIQGLYEATLRHLRDMRRIVFKGEDHDKEESE